MKKKILIFDTHPVQYRVQIYQALAGIDNVDLKVVYSNNSSVIGRMDQEFGVKIAWDIPLEEGYAHRYVSTALPDTRIPDFFQFEHRGVGRIVREERPDVVFVNGLTTRFYLAAYFAALRNRVPVWMRTETQDEAFKRSRLKTIARAIVWTTAYCGLARCFYIGELNKKHLLAHGVSARKLVRANYATFDRFKRLPPACRLAARRAGAQLGIPDDKTVVAFSGKLVPKKNPGLIIDTLERRPDKDRFVRLFVGDGELRPKPDAASSSRRGRAAMPTSTGSIASVSSKSAMLRGWPRRWASSRPIRAASIGPTRCSRPIRSTQQWTPLPRRWESCGLDFPKKETGAAEPRPQAS